MTVRVALGRVLVVVDVVEKPEGGADVEAEDEIDSETEVELGKLLELSGSSVAAFIESVGVSLAEIDEAAVLSSGVNVEDMAVWRLWRAEVVRNYTTSD